MHPNNYPNRCCISPFQLCFSCIVLSVDTLLKCLNLLFYPIRVTLLFIWNKLGVQFMGFIGGYCLGKLYYNCMLKDILLRYNIGIYLSLGISLLLGVSNAICSQMRCITLLVLPMFCGKPGRGVLKAVMLTFVVAGPITNMGLNAREVVRVYACSSQLAYNLSRERYAIVLGPVKNAMLDMRTQMGEVHDALRYISDVEVLMHAEVENTAELHQGRQFSDYIDSLFGEIQRCNTIEGKYSKLNSTNDKTLLSTYAKKLEYRCQDQISRAIDACVRAFDGVYEKCLSAVPVQAALTVCGPLKSSHICKIMNAAEMLDICDSQRQINPGLAEGYSYLKMLKKDLVKSVRDIRFQRMINYDRELQDIQDAKETGDRVLHAFEEKSILMLGAITAVSAYVALLMLRVPVAAGRYHDAYLTAIGHDNVYITTYFNTIDRRRMERNLYTILPLKKMERRKYIDVNSFGYTPGQRSKLVSQVLKVMLEMVTATTFVMLDRLFYEALDVVRQLAEASDVTRADRDLLVEVTMALVSHGHRLDTGKKARQTLRHQHAMLAAPQPHATYLLREDLRRIYSDSDAAVLESLYDAVEKTNLRLLLPSSREAAHPPLIQRHPEEEDENAEDTAQRGRAGGARALPLRGEPAELEDQVLADAVLAECAARGEDEMSDLRGDATQEQSRGQVVLVLQGEVSVCVLRGVLARGRRTLPGLRPEPGRPERRRLAERRRPATILTGVPKS